MKKNRSLLNVIVAIVFKLILFPGNFLVRRYLIHLIGNEINGIYSLYLSIIGVLSVAELGIGEAIVFCMYKPIVEGDTEKTASLYNLFKRIYFVIGLIIAVAGCAVMPFLPYLAKGHSAVDVNLYLTFGLMLVSVVMSYSFSAKTSLMNAYKDNYITTIITSSGLLLQYVLQIAVLFITRSFVWYIICCIIANAVQWILTEIIIRKKYPSIEKNIAPKIDGETKNQIVKNVKAMFMHRIGGVFVNMADNLIISACLGIAILGRYSNYTMVMTAMTGTMALFFTPLTSTIGHLFVKDKEAFKTYYSFFHAFNFALGCVFFLGYYAVINSVISIFFGANLELNRAVIFVITLNHFIQFMRQTTLLFRDASGTFYHDRWKPLIEGGINLVLSIVFVLILRDFAGEEIAVVGVILATILTSLLVCHTVEPYVLHKHGMNSSPHKYFIQNYLYIAIFAIMLVILDFSMVSFENVWIELLLNGLIAVGLAMIPIVAVVYFNKNFRSYVKSFLRKIKLKFVK